MIRKLVYAVALLALSWAEENYVLVDTDKGTLRGLNTTSLLGAKYVSFKGIPYAKSPLGELRFKGPKEVTEWTGVRDAVSHGNQCPHLSFFHTGRFVGEEDCLFLNVYTPSLEVVRLPVMVWIHGGSFDENSGNDDLQGPDYFVGSGVILVTMNYRLGALGFLSTEDDGAPGNAGLKDQVAALRWVRRNIAKFGGDPENVTIFGQDAGGASVQYHLLSPMSTGLFAKAIAQSGSVLNTWAQSENPANVTIRMAQALGAEDVAGNKTKALEFLKTAPCKDIVQTQGFLLTREEQRKDLSLLFVPSIEIDVQSEEVFLSKSPREILESGNFTKVPYIAGHTGAEGLYFFLDIMFAPELKNRALDYTELYVPSDIKNQELRTNLAKSMRKFYFDDKPIEYENITNLINLYTDVHFLAGIKRAFSIQLQSSNAPQYFYVFSYDGGLNLIKSFTSIRFPGALHGDELGYMFSHKLPIWRKPEVGTEDEYVINTIIRLWTNFAKYGDPTPPGDSLTWKPFTINESNYLNITGRDTRVAKNPNPERTEFWANAYDGNSAS